VGLLRAWIDSGEKTFALSEPYYAPSTTLDSLSRADAAFRQTGNRPFWTLASGLFPDEIRVTGLPHGAYVFGDSTPLVETLGLRRVTPHNFLVLRAEPAAETSTGGIYMDTRDHNGRRLVALPQLAVDLASIGGRGNEQAEFLLEKYSESLPFGGHARPTPNGSSSFSMNCVS
jgi:hypothetical protein